MRLNFAALLVIPFFAGCQCNDLCQYKAAMAQSAPRGGNLNDLESEDVRRCIKEMDDKGIRGDARIAYNRRCRHIE